MVVAFTEQRCIHHSLEAGLFELCFLVRVEFLIFGELLDTRICDTLLFIIVVLEFLPIFHAQVLASVIRQH